MIRRMQRRPIARGIVRRSWAVFAFVGASVLFIACNSKSENGAECLKDTDCQSDYCVQYVCVDPNAGKGVLPAADTGTSTDSTPADTAMPMDASDTGAGDTGSPMDTSTPADTGSDAASDG